MVVRTPFAVADDDVAAAQSGEERCGDLSGMRSGSVLGDILGTVLQPQLVALDEGLHRTDVGEWRDDDDFAALSSSLASSSAQASFWTLEIASRWSWFIFQLPASSRVRSLMVSVFLTRVLRVRAASCLRDIRGWHRRRWRCGRRRHRRSRGCAQPPRNHRRRRRSVAVLPAVPVAPVRAVATALVPAAKAGNSKTPIGPFQNTVVESAMISA
jgi:hypothetical protein